LTASLTDTTARKVRKRSVFYFCGFDGRGSKHYHTLYRDEAANQELVSGLKLSVGDCQKTATGNSFWNISVENDEGTVETRYEFLRIEDIVRQHWTRNWITLTVDLVKTIWVYLFSGAFLRMVKLAWPLVLAIVLPFLLLCVLLVGTPLLAILVAWLSPSAWVTWAVLLCSVVCISSWFGLAAKLERDFKMTWMIRAYAFFIQLSSNRVAGFDERMAQHAQTILNRIRSDSDDEVLIVGHSLGSILAVTSLTEAIRREPLLGYAGPNVALLTLGQVLPMLTSLPKAQRFRDDLKHLSHAEGIHWIDFSAPPDGCCFALIHPLHAIGEDALAAVDHPKLLSPRFADMFEPSEYATIRKDKFRCHFQYLMASKKTSLYDYFAITAGDTTLAERFSGTNSVTGYKGLSLF
jgi:hypothetical protein